MLISQICSWNETLHVSDSSSVHHQEFFTVHTAVVYVIQVCWQLAWNETLHVWTLRLSIIRSFSLYTQQWYMSYRFADSLHGMKLYMFQTFPLSIIRSFSLYTQQWYMSYRFVDSLLASCQQTCATYTTAVCTVKKNSWWWSEELSETCRVSFHLRN